MMSQYGSINLIASFVHTVLQYSVILVININKKPHLLLVLHLGPDLFCIKAYTIRPQTVLLLYSFALHHSICR